MCDSLEEIGDASACAGGAGDDGDMELGGEFVAIDVDAVGLGFVNEVDAEDDAVGDLEDL